MKRAFFFFLIVIVACSENNKVTIDGLSGYWEIKEVLFADGSSKTYTINNTVDYFQLTGDSSGYRKKLQPKLNGHFYTLDSVAYFIIKNDGIIKLHYKTLFDEWGETIEKLNNDELIVKNKAEITYIYKRFKNSSTE
ncbi:hypothetical protein [Leptobacterium sp. I13]|uniref:hypothetical protein n=1 Tax=Leptobacterium meishanense TaxID=3128904 RepID=UPI0030EE4EF3